MPASLGMRVGVVGFEYSAEVSCSAVNPAAGLTTEGEPVMVGKAPLTSEDSVALDKRVVRGGTGSGRFWEGVAFWSGEPGKALICMGGKFTLSGFTGDS